MVREHGKPKSLRCDKGPEFAGRMLDQWPHLTGVEIDFSGPGKPTDNGLHRGIQCSPASRVSDTVQFLSMADARDRIEAWRIDYNELRPHTAPDNLTPREFIETSSVSPEICVAPESASGADPPTRPLI